MSSPSPANGSDQQSVEEQEPRSEAVNESPPPLTNPFAWLQSPGLLEETTRQRGPIGHVNPHAHQLVDGGNRFAEPSFAPHHHFSGDKRWPPPIRKLEHVVVNLQLILGWIDTAQDPQLLALIESRNAVNVMRELLERVKACMAESKS